MSSAEAFHAKTSVSQAKAPDLLANAAAYGQNTPVLLAKFDPNSSSWRTSQLCLDGDLETFSETWPRSGMMQNGTAFQLQPLAPLIAETASGLLPTPKASDAERGGRGDLLTVLRGYQTRHAGTLPTPRANDALKMGDFDTSNPRNGLPAALGSLTPGARAGRMSRRFVEWMMGLQPGWTLDCLPSEIPSSLKSRR